MTEPKYRFKKTDGHTYPAINTRTVGEVFSFVTEKNKGRMVDNVITNSAEFGLVPQREFFDKDIASKDNTDGYTVIQKGDFVYNPRKSSTAPYGPFNCYRLEEKGIVSPLYTCLRQKMDGVSADYLEWYFASNAWHRYIYNNGAQGGARHDRVGMTNDLMKGIPVAIPFVEEQNKISELLDSVTSLISTLTEEVRLWEEKKKGVMQKIFSQKVRFKDENGEDYPEWTERRFSEITFAAGARNKENLPLEPYAITNVSGFIPQNEAHDDFGYMKDTDRSAYMIVRPHSFGYNPARINVGSLGYYSGKNDVIVSSLYEIFQTTNEVYDEFLLQWFKTNEFQAWIERLQEGSVRLYFYYDKLKECKINLPSIDEQKRISECLSSMDDVISIKKQKLETWQNIKKGLLQQMFV